VTIRRRVLVTGRVQGVWFRDSCEREATRVGVAGWVRNLPDLRVEAAFEGEEAAVALLVEWCHRGPPQAAVTAVEVIEEPVSGDVGFRVVW
jgi:acylphosphatase